LSAHQIYLGLDVSPILQEALDHGRLVAIRRDVQLSASLPATDVAGALEIRQGVQGRLRAGVI
jgi:hypothetical protein